MTPERGWAEKFVRFAAAGAAFVVFSYVGSHDLVECFTEARTPQHCYGEPFGLSLVPQPPALPPDMGLAGVEAQRVRAVMDEEMAPMRSHPEFVRRAHEIDSAAATPEEAFQRGRALGQEAVGKGIARLPLEDLREWNRLRRLLANSDRVCAVLWTGRADGEALGPALAAFSDPDLHAWMRLSARAGVLEITASSPVVSDDTALSEAIVAMAATLPEGEREPFLRTLEAGEGADAAAACGAMKTMLDSATALPAPLQERYLRALAAL